MPSPGRELTMRRSVATGLTLAPALTLAGGVYAWSVAAQGHRRAAAR
jgi:hypothetical protein